MAAAIKSIEKWQELGHQLNINPEKLSNLFNSGRSGAECRDEMMAYWEKHDDAASWEKLARALARMGENQLADRIIKEQGVGGRAVTCATPTQNNQPTFANTEASNSTLRVMHANMHYYTQCTTKLTTRVCVCMCSPIVLCTYMYVPYRTYMYTTFYL